MNVLKPYLVAKEADFGKNNTLHSNNRQKTFTVSSVNHLDAPDRVGPVVNSVGEL